MFLSEVQHQDRALAILRRALCSGRIHHAWLFDGPEGIGKEMAALGLAARLLCLNQEIPPGADACGRCASCRLFAARNHPDFHLIERRLHKVHSDPVVRRSKGLFLVVDLIRDFLIQPAVSRPTVSPRRVFVMRDAERMNEQAQNALLKTLEEPPGQAVLILVTSAADRLLPTIRSRCQRVPFGLLPPAFVAEQLRQRVRLPAAAAETLARLADGRLGAALRWHAADVLGALDEVGAALDQLAPGRPELFGRTLVDIGANLAKRTRAAEEQALAAARNDSGPVAAEEANGERAFDQSADDEYESDEPGRVGRRAAGSAKSVPTDELREGLKLALMLVAELHRDALATQTAGGGGVLHIPEQRPRTAALAESHTADHLDACIRAVAHAEQMLDRNVAPQLAAERLAVALTGELPV